MLGLDRAPGPGALSARPRSALSCDRALDRAEGVTWLDPGVAAG